MADWLVYAGTRRLVVELENGIPNYVECDVFIIFSIKEIVDHPKEQSTPMFSVVSTRQERAVATHFVD